MKKQVMIWSFLSIFLFLFGCVSTPPFDQSEYDRVITLKLDALSLLENASKDFQLYQGEVSKIRKDMLFMLEYAKRKSNNKECITLMERMNDPEGSFLGNVLMEWELLGTLDKSYAMGLSSIISDTFDHIIDLLGKRIRK